ncbi:MAG: OmpA family protein [Myxococcota bacterium]
MLFSKDSTGLNEAAIRALNEVASKVLSTSYIDRLLVNGHSDQEGGPVAGLVLSRERAKAVVDYLAELGLSRSQMVAGGLGDAEPRADGAAAPDGNRRVDFALKLGDRCRVAP